MRTLTGLYFIDIINWERSQYKVNTIDSTVQYLWKLRSFEEDIDQGGFSDCLQVILEDKGPSGTFIRIFLIQNTNQPNNEVAQQLIVLKLPITGTPIIEKAKISIKQAVSQHLP